jgi:predicted nucleic acid-binding protein
MIRKILLFVLVTLLSYQLHSQQMLTSWSQNTIENYTKEMYDEAQKLTSTQLVQKNLRANSWSEVFLTFNASVNNYTNDAEYKNALVAQIRNTKETKLKGTSRLIIWDRIISGDIIFEGKGLVIENDLFLVCGRANQLLQLLTGKSFGIVTSNSTNKELEVLKKKWERFLSGETVEELTPKIYKNAKIP